VATIRCGVGQAEVQEELRAPEDGVGTPELPRSRLARRWRQLVDTVRRSGMVYLFSYAFISHVNLALMFGVAWALFVRTWHACPIEPSGLPWAAEVTCAFYRPVLLHRKFLASYGAMCLGLGTITRPLRAGMAVGLMPGVRRTISFFEDRLRCPKLLAYTLTIVVGVTLGSLCFAPAVFLSCAVLSVPVAGV